MNPLYITIGVIALLAIWLILTYNSLVKKENRVEEAWSDIDVQLKRRHNLIPNLVETVKGYAEHEEEVLSKVTEARNKAMNAENVNEKQEAENQLAGTLKSLFAVSESYPDLKASDNFLELQKELRDTEDKIQAARRFYNNNARDFNTKIESFPVNLIGSTFGFGQKDLFEIERPEERENVDVEF